MANPAEEVIKALDKDKKEKVLVILQEYENLRVQFTEDIKKRSEMLVSNGSLQDEIEGYKKEIVKNNAQAETYF